MRIINIIEVRANVTIVLSVFHNADLTENTERRYEIYSVLLPMCKSRDSVIGIATGYGLDDQGVGVRVLVEARMFTFPCRPDRL
jgi:hypothetical protein